MIFDDGEVVFGAGDHTDSAYFIETGEAEVFIDHDNKLVKVNHLMPHDLFGEMALFLSSGRSADVIAKGDMRAMKLNGPLFFQMVTENLDKTLGVMTALSEKIVNTSQQAVKNT